LHAGNRTHTRVAPAPHTHVHGRRLVGALRDAADAQLPIEIHADGRIILAALEPAEVALATILALLEGIPTAVNGDVPELFHDAHRWAEVA
jgi:hypothetical protein